MNPFVIAGPLVLLLLLTFIGLQTDSGGKATLAAESAVVYPGSTSSIVLGPRTQFTMSKDAKVYLSGSGTKYCIASIAPVAGQYRAELRGSNCLDEITIPQSAIVDGRVMIESEDLAGFSRMVEFDYRPKDIVIGAFGVEVNTGIKAPWFDGLIEKNLNTLARFIAKSVTFDYSYLQSNAVGQWVRVLAIALFGAMVIGAVIKLVLSVFGIVRG